MTDHRAVLIPVYSRASYQAIRAHMLDAARFPATWDEWSQRTADYCEALLASGTGARPLVFDLEAFARWCETKQMPADALARTEWLALEAKRLDRPRRPDRNGVRAPRPGVPTFAEALAAANPATAG